MDIESTCFRTLIIGIYAVYMTSILSNDVEGHGQYLFSVFGSSSLLLVYKGEALEG